MSYFSEVIADTPSSYLRLNEVSGATAADASGNGNVGTYVGSPTLGVNGLIAPDTDTAMQTTGNQQLTLPYTPPTNTFTIEFWWKWTANGTSEVIWRDNTNSAAAGYFILVSYSGVTVRIVGNDRITTDTNYRDGIRHHFVLSYDGTTATLHIDGVQIDQWTVSSATRPASPLHIGYNGIVSSQYQPGIYDEVALYNYVLPSARVVAHYNEVSLGTPNAQVEALYVETMATGTRNAQVEAIYVEGMATGTRNAQVETLYVEAMTVVLPAQVSSVYSEIIMSGTPPVQVQGIYTEIVLLPIQTVRFKGWGVPI